MLETSILVASRAAESGHYSPSTTDHARRTTVTDDQQRADVEGLLPLKPVEFLVLLVLMDGERHGYGIVQDMIERSDGKVRLLPGNLYAILRRLMGNGLLAESSRRRASDLEDQRRRYYGITALGKRVLVAEAERMRNLVRQVEASRLIEADTR